MGKAIKVLVVEDSEDDTQLAMLTLRRAGFDPHYRRVQDADSLLAAISEERWDAVLSDSRLPAFSGVEALRLFRKSGLDIPFIFVSGTIGEETAVEAMKAGASDYVMKENLARLAPALERELQQTEVRAERRQAQRDRDRHLDLLQAIADNTEAVIYAKDLQGRYLLANRRFLEQFHVGSETVIGKNDSELFPPDTASALRSVDRRVVVAKAPVTEEEVVPNDDGPRTYLSVKCPLRDRDGRVLGVFGISTDITERKRAEDALRASEERTRLIIDAALDAVVTIDADGVIIEWNPQAEISFGWQRGEVIGRTLTDTIIPPRYHDAHRRGLLRYQKTREANVLNQRIELTAVHRDGHEFPIELAITPIRSGLTLAFSAFVRDITERKLAESRLQEQVQRLSLLDQIACAIGQRQDLTSIYQVALGSVESLPMDFACVCRYDALDRTLTVTQVGEHSQALATELALGEGAALPLDDDALTRCLRGELIHEPDTAQLDSGFAQRLAGGSLRSLVIVPLQAEGRALGALLTARRQANAFSPADREFLRQLSAHVALAAQHAQLHASLQRAYDDLRRQMPR
jgi:PAS domain S-box-containing protein